mmetsp:Transcript_31500/g.36345  ORF Transcript_31500/g.36345 Transcript_31500/m.36345 type:complete len:379 (+) Transcript_31500:327-1463(+)|eukprot:CAMPEP_0194357768 /NCGR_PEP_ID=MMETSP0174-20130528/5208_1 /TAXON_ID=216777 /ORGANISM="Proboscia alata, Strain PI-D3" /LENGTH=378 /DNA_ID=CAMNT_0039127933 /DNA_START=329 /DNA_END=1465 /DNA_ORIENTATION=-
MYQRNSGNDENNGVKTRRAFRDVTNSTNHVENPSVPGHMAKKNAPAVPVLRPSASDKQNGQSRRQQKKENPVPSNPAAPTTRHSSRPALSRGLSRSASVVSNTSSYQHSGPIDNIDERDSDDPLCVTEYVSEMYQHFRSKERSTSVRPVYMENQRHVNERMRSILVDWLVEVHLKFKLVPETLYLTINLIDRYLERREVTRPKLQLVGVTCLLIASKYEEIYPPELRDLVYICDRAYSKEEILENEEIVLKALEYQITIPSAHAFLVRFLKAAHADKKMVQLSCYILDGTLQNYSLLEYLPSQMAAAAIFLARRAAGRNSWSPTLLEYAQYCEEEIAPIARAVLEEKNSASSELRAVTKKYSSTRYGGVANTVLDSEF